MEKGKKKRKVPMNAVWRNSLLVSTRVPGCSWEAPVCFALSAGCAMGQCRVHTHGRSLTGKGKGQKVRTGRHKEQRWPYPLPPRAPVQTELHDAAAAVIGKLLHWSWWEVRGRCRRPFAFCLWTACRKSRDSPWSQGRLMCMCVLALNTIQFLSHNI